MQIGFHDRDTEAFCDGSGFVWTDATPTHYTQWSAGEPNDWLCSSNGDVHNGANQNGAGQTCGSDCDGQGNGDLSTSGNVQHEDCTSMLKGRDWGWNDYHCDLQQQFVCGFCTAVCSPTSYTYVSTPMSQPAAEDYCIAQGGHLASAHGVKDLQIMQEIASSYSSSTNFWIGLHDREELGAVEGGCAAAAFMWTDATTNDFTNFAPGEPNDWSNGEAHCTTNCDTYWSPSGGGCTAASADSSGNEDCVAITPAKQGGDAADTAQSSRYGPHPIEGREGLWQMDDGVCATEYPFMCGFCATEASCQPQRYVFVPDELSMPAAQFACLQMGGNLASIHGEADSRAIEDAIVNVSSVRALFSSTSLLTPYAWLAGPNRRVDWPPRPRRRGWLRRCAKQPASRTQREAE